MRTDVDASDCTRGLYGQRKALKAESLLWEKKQQLLHQGLEPESVLRLSFQSDALPAELSPSLYTMV